MGYYRAAFFEDPNEGCNCKWENLYKKLQRYHDVTEDLSFFIPTDMSNKQFPLRRNDRENGQPTVTVVLDEKGVGTHVFVGSVNLQQAALIFAKDDQDYAFDSDTRSEIKLLLDAAAKPAKEAKAAKADA